MLPRNPNAFANSPLDRAGHLRRDPAWLALALDNPETEIIAFHQRRPLIVADGEAGGVRPGWLNGAIANGAALSIFLGLDGGRPRFAMEFAEPGDLAQLGRFEELRGVGPRLGADDVAILGCAKSLFEWHARHGFCSNCGARSEVAEAGWKRVCRTCSAEHFPRVDPVVIMVLGLGERLLLGRQKAWPKGMYSALAGFVEPGETIEEACARETFEESGLVLASTRLHSTQPWPFPSQLMVGLVCEVESDAVNVDEHELEAVRWFGRDEARQLLARTHPDCFAPPDFAVAHHLIKAWVDRD